MNKPRARRTRVMEHEIGTRREFWFPVRKRAAGPCGRRSLLVADRRGVYSFAYRRYIRETRYHRYRTLTADLAPVVRAYRSLLKLGMMRWTEHDKESRKKITLWKHGLMDIYWHAAPLERRERATERFLRWRYKHRMLYPFLVLDFPVRLGTVARRIMRGTYTHTWWLLESLVTYVLAIGILLFVAEELPRHTWWILSRSEIHRVLEFELTN